METKMTKKTKEVESKKTKCCFCKKKTVTFYFHACKRSIQEFYGCIDCDNWCVDCKDNWDNHDKKE